MKIKCDNGLCNRLNFIFSYFYKLNEKLIVCWKINNKCNGHFLDIFEPIENLEFTFDDSNVDIEDWKPCLAIENTKENIFLKLRLKKELLDEVIKLKKELKDYVAIHIRRTDKVANPGKAQLINKIKLTSDEEFIEFCKKTNKNIFLATDCYEIQNKFKEIFKNRLFFYEKINKPWNFTVEECTTNSDFQNGFRPTSLKSAAIDLFACVFSKEFMGTNLSTMSQFICYNKKFLKNKIL